MSTGFRLFLLMLLMFGALYVYHRRAEDIAFWLWAPVAVRDISGDTTDSAPGRVNSYLDPEVNVLIVSPEVSTRPPPDKSRVTNWGNPMFAGEPDEVAVQEEYTEFVEEVSGTDPPPDPVEGVFMDPGESGEPGVEPADSEPPQVPAPELREEEPLPKERVYRVKPGDNLCKIAGRFLGKQSRYREIMKLNRDVLHGKTLLLPGMKLRLPLRDQR